MLRLTKVACSLAIWMPCFLKAQAFMFSAMEQPSENMHELVAQISSIESKSDLKGHFRDLASNCSGDILIFAEGKTLCGELVDMPPLVEEKKKIDISEVSAIIFDSEKEVPTVQYVLHDGHTITNELSKESFRFSVEYLENGGEQRVQIFYISPKDIRYIIIGPRLPNSPPGINSALLNKSNEILGGSAKGKHESKVVEAVQLAVFWSHADSHSLLSNAVAAVLLPSHTITAMHNVTFSNIVSYYAELGVVDDDSLDFNYQTFEGQHSFPFLRQSTSGLILGPKALFASSETFEPFDGLAVEEPQNVFNDMLATAGASSFCNDFSLDDLQVHNLFAMEFNVHYDDEENSEEDEDTGLSGIKYIAHSEDPLTPSSLFGTHKEAVNHIAFLTDSCNWFKHKYQCTEGCEAAEWPPVKKSNPYSSVEHAQRSLNEHFKGHDLDPTVLSEVIDKIKQNETIANESLLTDLPHNPEKYQSEEIFTPSKPSTVRFGNIIDIASYPVSNQDYYRFVKAAKYPPPSHWINGVYAQADGHAPIVNVTYKDAVAYAEWAGERLPSYDELAKASASLDPLPKGFKEWTSTPSIVDNECFRVYRQKGSELLLQPGKYAAPNIGFRCVKDVE